MVRSCAGLLDTIEVAQLPDKGTLEVAALVRMYSSSTFSIPFLAGDNMVKSMAKISFGLDARRGPIGFRTGGWLSLAAWHRSQAVEGGK